MILADLEGRHRGSDVWVLASGPTAGFVSRDFFRGKVVVGVNQAADRHGLFDVDCTVYTYSHYHCDVVPFARQRPGHVFVACEGDQGFPGSPEVLLPNVIYHPHHPTQYDFDVERAWPPPGGLIVGSTSTHGAMHLACHLGASSVILVGADCGTLDGAANEPGHVSGNLDVPDPMPWLARWNSHLEAVAARLRVEYQCSIHSLNPWVNLNLEGHGFRGAY